MYTLTFEGTAGADQDIAKVRIYLAGGPAIEAPAAPSQPFTVQADHPTSGTITVEHSFVDTNGNESARRAQQVFIPDQNAPNAPGSDLNLVSVVWA